MEEEVEEFFGPSSNLRQNESKGFHMIHEQRRLQRALLFISNGNSFRAHARSQFSSFSFRCVMNHLSPLWKRFAL
jgi:hypothetical protein